MIVEVKFFQFRLRDLSLTKQAENDTLTKQTETLEHKLKVLTKENENAKANFATMQATIADLKEQVRSINLSFSWHIFPLFRLIHVWVLNKWLTF